MRTWSHFSKKAVIRQHHFCKKSKSNKWVGDPRLRVKPWVPLIIMACLTPGKNSADHKLFRTNTLWTNADTLVIHQCLWLQICHWQSSIRCQNMVQLDSNKHPFGVRQCIARVWQLGITIKNSTMLKIHCLDNRHIIAQMLTYASSEHSFANLQKESV